MDWRWTRGRVERDKIRRRRDGHVQRRIALDHQIVALGTDADVEEGFELAQVFIEGAEQGGNPGFRHGDLAHGCCGYAYPLMLQTVNYLKSP